MTATEYKPIFDWSAPRSRRLTLTSFIAASAAVHAFCFYVFQIIYPPTVALTPPPGRISLINGDTDEGRVLLRWIEAEDPALSSYTQRPPESGNLALPKVDHVPSYLTSQPVLRELPSNEPELHVPSARPPGPVPMNYAAPAMSTVVTPTSVQFSEEISAPPPLPPMQFKSTIKDAPQSTQFRIAVGRGGDLRFCFLQSSSGDPALDEQARQQLLRTRFLPNEQELTWGTATFDW
ncbi:MAG: energy transducer TonB, partial [Chthoniobacterales bacterium]